MSTAVIYQSNYGSTETYAKWIAADLGADLLVAKQVKAADLQKYSTLVYGGGIYGGSLNGIALLTKHYETIKDKELYLFTVCSSDVTVPEVIKAIRSGLAQKLPPDLWEKLHVYHLRGGMQVSKLNLPHRMMIGMMIKMLRKKPEGERTADDKGMLATISQDTDFTDRTSIAPLVADIKAGVAP